MNKKKNCNPDGEPLGKYLSIAYRALNSFLDKRLQEYDIGRGQFPFLIKLYQEEGVSQQELCDYYNLDKATAGRAIARLEENDFITRERDPADKRQYKVYLTEKGRQFKPLFLEILTASEECIKNDLTEYEVVQFRRIIKKIIGNLGVKI